MYIAIVCKPSCDVMIFEVNLIFLIKPFFLHDQRYGCSFVVRLSWKNIFFFWENICFLQNIQHLQKKLFLYGKKDLYWSFFLTEKNENVKINISFGKYIFIQKMFVLQIKYKSFLNIYSFCKKKILIIKNIFVKTSLWTE